MAETNKSTLKSRDKAIIKVGVAIVFTIVAYLAGNSLTTKTNVIKKDIETLQQRVDKLEDANRNKSNLQKELKRMNSDTQYILKKFPSDCTFEKVLDKVSELWDERYSFGMTNISYNDNGVFYTFQDATGREDESLGKISSVTITVAYSTDLKTLENMIDLINQEFETKVSISTINIELSDEITSVEGEVTFTAYYGANEREYDVPKFDVDSGKKSLFN